MAIARAKNGCYTTIIGLEAKIKERIKAAVIEVAFDTVVTFRIAKDSVCYRPIY